MSDFKKKRLIASENLAEAREAKKKIANYKQKSLCRKIAISRTSR